jgi:hypothetical protein
VALWGLLACMLIPIGVSNLRGLTHILTCEDELATSFTIRVDGQGYATLLATSPAFDRDDVRELCGGLVLDMEAGSPRRGRAELRFTITNNTSYGWHGSLRVEVGATPVPIDIGEIAPGDSARDTIDLRLDPDASYEIEGTLLVGP